jgi:hypothetical protein
MVDPQADWTSQRETDRLSEAESEEQALEVYAAVKALKAFKAELRSLLVVDFFSTPTDLADRAGSAVAKFLLKDKREQQNHAERALQELMEKVALHLERGTNDVALTYLEDAAGRAHELNRAAIADKRFELASKDLSLLDERLALAARSVIDCRGKRQAEARLWLGKCESQLARGEWQKGEQGAAWERACEARQQLELSIELDSHDPDTFGTLGGLLKRMAQWATVLHPDQATPLEDAMLGAYQRGWSKTQHAYPLLNFVEQRATLRAKRDPVALVELIGADEKELRETLAKALKKRESQLGNAQDRPWAAFDVARGRHYLRPNVPGFLEDLESAVGEARSVARVSSDRYMVATTRDSLASLASARVQLDGLTEAIELLELAVKDDDWFTGRPTRPTAYLERELLTLRADLTEAFERQEWQSAQADARLRSFMRDAEVRWTRDDEVRFQAELVTWKRSLAPTELKVARALWKVVGTKTVDLLAGGIPIDWSAAAELLTKSR